MQDFSVLMSVYRKDSPAWLREAINSILSQTAKPKEIIVVCDGPLTVELDKALAEYKNLIKTHRLEKNMGLGEALRQGLGQCSCGLVARMDSDDISVPDRFERQLAFFDKNPGLAAAGGFIEEFDSHTLKPVSIRKVPLTSSEIRKFLKTRNPMNHVSVMFRKDAVMKAGGYKPFPLLEDYYLWARMAAMGLALMNLPDILVKVRVDANMYGRRGGFKYFKNNLAMSRKLRELGLITLPEHLFNACVRFCVQVLMPEKLRSLFYKNALR